MRPILVYMPSLPGFEIMSHALYETTREFVERCKMRKCAENLGHLGLLANGVAPQEIRPELRHAARRVIVLSSREETSGGEPFLVALFDTEELDSPVAKAARVTPQAAFDIPPTSGKQRRLDKPSINTLVENVGAATPMAVPPTDSAYFLYRIIGHSLREA